jgi:hypothetical protein
MADAITSAVDILVIAYSSLGEAEKEEFGKRLDYIRVAREAETDDELGALLRSIRKAAEIVGCEVTELSVTEYRRLGKEREELAPLSRIVNRLGSWRQGREAAEWSVSQTTRKVEARLSMRGVKGKVWRYSRKVLQDSFNEALEHFGTVPMASEFDEYRQRRLELARAQGNHAFHFPQAHAYRRRLETWEKACLAMGATTDQLEERLERGRVGMTA